MARTFPTNLDVKIGKAICELRVKPRLDHLDRVFTACQGIYDKHFSQWNNTQAGTRMWSPANNTLMVVDSVRWSLISEQPESLDKFEEHAQEVLLAFASALGVEVVDRLGLRVMYYVSRDMTFDELVKLFQMHNHSGVFLNLECMKGKISDDSFILNTQDGEFKFHYEAGPVTSKELFKKLNYDLIRPELTKLPEVAIWTDADASLREIPTKRLGEAITNSISKNHKNINEVINFLCGKAST